MTDIARLGIEVDSSSTTKGAASLDKLAASGAKAERQVEAVGRASSATAKHVRAIGSNSNIAAGQTANLTAQFNDIGMMLAAGQNPFMLAMQQGTQVTQVLNQMGGGTQALRAVAQAFRSMINPVNLATLGIIAAGAALAQWVIGAAGASREAKSFEDQIDELSSAIAAYKSYTDDAAEGTDRLAERFGRAGGGAQAVAETLAELARIEAIEKLDAAVSSLVADFGDFNGELIQVTDQTRALAEAILGPGVDEFSQELLGTVRSLSNEFEISTQSAYNLVSAMRAFSEADSVDEQVAAAVALNEQFIRVFGSVSAIPPELREVARQASLIALQAAEIQGAMDRVKGSALDVKAAVQGISDATSAAIGVANNLAAAWGGLAANAWSAASAMAAARVRNDGMTPTEVASLAGQYAAYGEGRRAFDERVQAGMGDITGGIPRPVAARPRGGGGGGGVSEINAMTAAYERLRGQLDPAWEAAREYEEAITTLNAALAAGLITQEEYTELVRAAGLEFDPAQEAAKEFADTMKGYVTDAVEDFADAFGKLVTGGFDTFKDFARSVLDTFKNMLAQMIAMAARNRIMVALGIGGVAAPGAALAQSGLGALSGQGGGILSGIFGSGGFLGSMGSGLLGASPALGTGLLGGLGSTIASTFGAGGGIGGLFSIGANAAAAGGGIAATIGAALPVVGLAVGLFSLFRRKPPISAKDYRAIAAGIDLTGIEIDEMGGLSKRAAAHIKKLSGGVDEFNKKTQAYFDAFFTDAEKLELATEAVEGVFASLDMAVPKTRAEFREIVESLELTTKSGREAYSALLDIAPTFAEITNQAESMSAAIAQLAYGQGSFRTLQEQVFAMTSDGYRFGVNELSAESSILAQILNAIRSGNINNARLLTDIKDTERRAQLAPETVA